MVFGQKMKNLALVKKMIPSERASQEEPNGTNFSSVAPFSEELWVWIYTCLPFKCVCVVKVVILHLCVQLKFRNRIKLVLQ